MDVYLKLLMKAVGKNGITSTHAQPIVSKSLHWTHIERPENVAYACVDFINDVDKKLI